jgi:hypothetical protein
MNKEELKLYWKAEAAEKRCNEMIESYMISGNPLYGWGALWEWINQNGPEPEKFPMPKALLVFLFVNCKEMIGLSLGLKPQEYRDGERIERRAAEKRNITPGEACDFLPEALRLRGYKWNAFDDYARNMDAVLLGFAYDSVREGGGTELEALKTLSDLSGVNDERTLRRKMKGGRGPRQKSPYPLPKRAPPESGEASGPIEKTPKATGAKKA